MTSFMLLRVPALISAAVLLRSTTKPVPSAAKSSDYLFLWASSTDSTAPDFLAVYDVRVPAAGARYGALIATLPVPGRGHRTHHTEHLLAADRQLFANNFRSGESFIFDLSRPTQPRLVKQFGEVGALMRRPQPRNARSHSRTACRAGLRVEPDE